MDRLTPENLSPIGINVMVLPDDQTLETNFGLVLPETINPYEGNPALSGTVLAIGPHYLEESGDVLSTGDRVFIQNIGATHVYVGDTEVIFVRQVSHPRGILAKIDD